MPLPFLDKDLVAAARRNPGFIGREILVYRKLESTNDTAWELAAKGCRNGLVVCAETQLRGRGQFERIWESAAGKGLWFSVLIDLPENFNDTALLTYWVASTLAPALTLSTELPIRIKAPNDLYVYGKKLGGILVETRKQENSKSHRQAVLGIGINVHQQREDFSRSLREKAISVMLARQEEEFLKTTDPTMESIMAALLDALENTREQVENTPDLLRAKYEELTSQTF
ncbi:MAG: biotin--[acetyl-CoA-carboxylase] ligase [Chthoniobacterales bacterium]